LLQKLFQRNSKNPVILLALILMLVMVVACTPTDQPGDDEQESNGPVDVINNGDDEEEFMVFPVYYVKATDTSAYLVREIREVPLSQNIFISAMEELIVGNPQTEGAMRVLPEGTKVRNVSVRDGIATADFSSEVLRANLGAHMEELGIQSIVNTLTDFPGINSVSFSVDGGVSEEALQWWGHVGLYEQPFQRDLSQVVEPSIWVSHPVDGQELADTVIITGSAMVYEGTVQARVIDSSGQELVSGFTTAETGAPGRGNFRISLDYTPTGAEGNLEVFWESPEDGREMGKVVVPVVFKGVPSEN
jgi:hypothetical protein